jgi:LEA14-like dessication related protein
MRIRLFVLALALFLLQGCAGLDSLGALGQLVQPPRFEQVPDRPAEIRLQGLSGAGIRLWTKVSNPNPFGFRLGTLRGTLYLENSRAADADFPLGLSLGAGSESVIPIDISINFTDLPGLSGVGRRILAREAVPYRLEGTIGVDAGRLGQPVFGPMTLLRGETSGR